MSAVALRGRGLATNGETTVDAFLGGRVEAVQPATGHHRAGLEAVLLAASLSAKMEGLVVDLGAGAGVAGFCIAARCPKANLLLVERDGAAVDCARETLARPANRAVGGRVKILEADISDGSRLGREAANAVVFNPPFYQARSASASPAPSRAGAHILDEAGLDPWFRAAATLAKSGATATAIFRADGLDLLMAAAAGRFGALDILPIAPRQGTPAQRILVRGTKASRAALRLLPPLVLHENQGSGFRPEVEAILRGAVDLATVVPAWKKD